MTRTDRMSIALVVAFTAAGLAVMPVTKDRIFLLSAFVLMAASAIIAAIVRRLGGNSLVATVLAFIPGVALWLLTVGDDPRPMISDTWTFVILSVPPMEPHSGFRLIAALGLWLLYLVGEILANDLEQPAWTFPVLLTPYLVPALGMRIPTPLGYGVWAGLGWLAVLLADAAWRNREHSGRPRAASATAAATALGAVAVVVSLVVAPLLPLAGIWTLGAGLAGLSVWNDPNADLVRSLRSTSSVPVLTYVTDQPGGTYLRLATLPYVDDDGFHDRTTTALPPDRWTPDTPGDGRPGQTRWINITSEKFASKWLPLPPGTVNFAITQEGAVPADGWSYDPLTRNVTASGVSNAIATYGLRYQATFSPATLRQVRYYSAGDPRDDGLTLGLPPGMDVSAVRELAEEAVGSSNAGQQALDLVEWFASGDYVYDTATVDGSTLETIEDFLFGSRRGYCEQFAGAMALMARTLGIPSRVVIGFLPGTQQADGSWAVAPRQMHAWVELYLSNPRGASGWYQFDPTPAAALAAAEAAAQASAATVLPVPEPEPEPSESVPEETPSALPSASADPVDPGTPPAETSLPIAAWAPIAAGVVLLALAATPALVRTSRRRRRLSALGPPGRRAEEAWDELRDAVLDAGRSWPSASPRRTAGLLAPVFGGRSDEFAALALLVERARFAPTDADVGQWVDPTEVGGRLSRALRDQTPWWRRLWPRSVFR